MNYLVKILSTLRALKDDFPEVKVIADDGIESLSLELNEKLSELLILLNLNQEWSEEQALDLEIRKSVVRGVLRYCEEGIKFSSRVASVTDKNANLPYHTLIYPMIHLPNDLSEKGVMHTDQILSFGKTLTSWTAITRYDYDGLSGVNIKNKFFRFFVSKFPDRIKISKFKVSIPVNFGRTNQWGGMYPHIGNLNTSKTVSCACVVRASSKPFFHERICRLGVPPKLLIQSSGSPEEIGSYYEILSEGVAMAKQLVGCPLDAELAKQLIAFCEASEVSDKRVLSFGFSLLYQRLKYSLSDLMEAQKHHLNNTVLLTLSYLFGGENLVYLERFYDKATEGDASAQFISVIEGHLRSSEHYQSKNWQLAKGFSGDETAQYFYA